MTPLQSATAAFMAANRAHHEAAKTMEAAESALDTAVQEALAAHFKQAFIFREQFEALAGAAKVTCCWIADEAAWMSRAHLFVIEGALRTEMTWSHQAASPDDAVRAALYSLSDHLRDNGCSRDVSDDVYHLNSAIWRTDDR